MSVLEIQLPKNSRSPKRLAVGIDLGTTHSLVACDIDGKVKVLVNEKGKTMLPSVVRYVNNRTPIVGEEAKAYYAKDPKNTITSVKRLMGRSPKDLAASGLTYPYEFVDFDAPLSQMHTVAGNVTPIEVSAEILKNLWQRVHELDNTIIEAVVTVPAYFDDAQRQATKDAATIAGIKVLRLLNEPTAAAIAYGLDKNTQGVCFVFDLGGGTFDVSLLEINQGVFQVLATGGDTALGGDDIDHLIAHWVIAQLGLPIEKVNFAEILVQARLAKEALSYHDSAKIVVDNLAEIILDIHTLNQLITPLIDKIFIICQRAMRDARLLNQDIQHFILVGGATRIKLIQARMAQWSGKKPLIDIDPDQVVAIGAALSASALVGNRKDENLLLLDVIPLSLGVEMMGGVVEKILMRNTPIPAFATQTFTTFQDGQNGMSLHIVQGERELAQDCRSLAQLDLTGFPAMPAGKARIEVTFQVDADGLLNVQAKEMSTKIQSHIEVKPTFGLTQDAITALLKNAILHADEDLKQRHFHEKITQARYFKQSLQEALAQDGILLTSNAREQLATNLAQLDKALNLSDLSMMKQAMNELQKDAEAFAELRLNTALKEVVAGKTLKDIEKEIL